jgi:hypothetical protein
MMLFTAKAWRERAQEARIRAEQSRDAASKDVMLSIAASYDRLADMAEHSPTDHLSTPR